MELEKKCSEDSSADLLEAGWAKLSWAHLLVDLSEHQSDSLLLEAELVKLLWAHPLVDLSEPQSDSLLLEAAWELV